MAPYIFSIVDLFAQAYEYTDGSSHYMKTFENLGMQTTLGECPRIYARL